MNLNENRICKAFDVYVSAGEDACCRYRVLEDIQEHSFAIVQMDYVYFPFDANIQKTQDLYFHENLVLSWMDRSFYPSLQDAIDGFGESMQPSSQEALHA